MGDATLEDLITEGDFDLDVPTDLAADAVGAPHISNDNSEDDEDEVQIVQVIDAPFEPCMVCNQHGDSWVVQGPDCDHVAHVECVRRFSFSAGIEVSTNFRCPMYPCPCRFPPPEIEDSSDDDEDDYAPGGEQSSSSEDDSSEYSD